MRHYISPSWPAPKNIHAYTTTRQHGYSQPPFDSFNLGGRGEDNKEHVAANRRQLVTDLQLPSEPFWLKQVHGNQVVCANPLRKETPAADASYATEKNQVCLVLTADCLPILLCNRAGTKVAAIHAGWRGLAAGVIEATLEILDTPGNQILAWLGPAIGPRKFEVGEEVREQFLHIDKEAQQAFLPANAPNKWLGNLYLLAQQRLQKYQVNQIYGGDHCTFTEKEQFFSFRRDHGKTGNMASLIWLS